MTDALMLAATEATQEVASAVTRAAGDVMRFHGADPNGPAIVAAGFAMAIRAMKEIDPVIPRVVFEMLKEDMT